MDGMEMPMAGLSNDLAEIDRTIHEPARLAIMTALTACKSADFLFLQRLTGLTAGNLSSHLMKLESSSLVWIDKQIAGKRTHTTIGLTEMGRKAIQQHWDQLEALRNHAWDEGLAGSEEE
jgi:DNA-binding MarR family transcriptional regulator